MGGEAGAAAASAGGGAGNGAAAGSVCPQAQATEPMNDRATKDPRFLMINISPSWAFRAPCAKARAFTPFLPAHQGAPRRVTSPKDWPPGRAGIPIVTG